MANISQNVNIEMLEKLPDGTYKRKYPKTRADDGTTFDEHLAEKATQDKYGHIKLSDIPIPSKEGIGLGNVDNVKQASKSEFDEHNNDATRHMTSVERTKWNAVDNKVDKVTGKGLSTNDYTTVEKNKLSGIATDANNYIHPTSHPASMITGLPTSLPADGGSATTAKHLIGDDTRNVNSNPSEYMDGGSRYIGRAGWQTEFKSLSTMGLTELFSGGYCYLQTHTPWSDPSGGYPIQIAYGNRIPCWRVGISKTTWSAWQRLSDGGNANTVNGFTVGVNVPANAKFTDTVFSGNYNDLSNKPTIPDTNTLMPISGGVLENYREKLATVPANSGSINLSLGNVFQHSPSGNRTYSITNAVNGQAHSFTLIITQTFIARTITFPSSVRWQGGEIPDMSTANKTYVLTFMTVNGGTTWLGMFGGEF